MTSDIVKICYSCKEYLPIHPEDPTNQIKLRVFENMHRGHMTQTIGVNEMRAEYKLMVIG